MVALVSFFVHVLVIALLLQYSKAVQDVNQERVYITYDHGFDNCKDVTDSTSDETRAATDLACQLAFEALDNKGLNDCKNWREAGCRLLSGQKYRQCTCKILYCDDNSLRRDIIKPFRECAVGFLDQSQVQAPTAGFLKNRQQYDEALLAALARRRSRYPESYFGVGSSDGAFVFDAGEADNSRRAFISGEGSSSRGVASGSLPIASGQIDPSRPHQCPVCFNSYRTKGFLGRHIRSHNREDKMCRGCNYFFSSKAARDSHMQNFHSKTEKGPRSRGPQPRKRGRISTFREHEPTAFTCSQCGSSYASNSALLDHQVCHTTLDTYCFECKMTFASRQGLRAHIQKRHPEDALAREEAENKLYEEEKPEKCDQCNKRYKTAQGLREHKAYHDGKTKCDECDAVFQQRCSLYTHKATAHPKKDH